MAARRIVIVAFDDFTDIDVFLSWDLLNRVERPLVLEGNVATAAGCLAAQRLCGWIIERLAGQPERDRVIASIQPVGGGLFFETDTTRPPQQVAIA